MDALTSYIAPFVGALFGACCGGVLLIGAVMLLGLFWGRKAPVRPLQGSPPPPPGMG